MVGSLEQYFDHEKLKVYNNDVEFIRWWHEIKKGISTSASIIDQMDRASDSIALNIAEGTGKYTGKDKARYYDISRGSALESASCLDCLEARELMSRVKVNEGKDILKEIVSMLFGLIKSTTDRSYEPEDGYHV